MYNTKGTLAALIAAFLGISAPVFAAEQAVVLPVDPTLAPAVSIIPVAGINPSLASQISALPRLLPAEAASLQQVAAPAQLSDAAVRGKTLLLVGTRGSRPFILQETVRVARELGLRLMLLDKPENRKNSEGLIPDADFIAAPIDKRDDKTTKAIADQVLELRRQRKIDNIIAFRSHHAKLVGKIVDATGIEGLPGRVALTAEDKARTRRALNAAPELSVPFAEVKSADEVRQFFRQNGGNGAKFVMKSKLGENSRFVELGIDSEEGLVNAFLKMDAALRAEAKRKEASDTIFNRYPGVIVEKMLEPAAGTVEASVEMVVQRGEVKFAMVSDTHGIGNKGELAGGAMTFPSQMTQEVHDKLIAASAKALEVVGLRDGNARIDIMMTKDGPKIIEVNPFLGGAAIFTAVQLVSGVSLVEWGIRAVLGLSLPEVPKNKTVVDYRFAASQNTGEILSITGVDEAKAVPGVAHVQLLAEAGDAVKAPVENGYEEWAEIMGTGETYAQAKAASIEGLSKIKAKILSEQTADYLQPRDPIAAKVESFKKLPGALDAHIHYGETLSAIYVVFRDRNAYRLARWTLRLPSEVDGIPVHGQIATPEGVMNVGYYDLMSRISGFKALPGVLNAKLRRGENSASIEVVFGDQKDYRRARWTLRLPKQVGGIPVRAYIAAPSGPRKD